jgi:hypothetical protein
MLAGGVDLPELGGHDDLVTDGRQRVAHELLVRERAIDLRRVKERHAEVNGLADQIDPGVPVHRGASVVAHPHAPEPERRYFQPARPQHPFLQSKSHAFNRTTVHAEKGGRIGTGSSRASLPASAMCPITGPKRPSGPRSSRCDAPGTTPDQQRGLAAMCVAALAGSLT